MSYVEKCITVVFYILNCDIHDPPSTEKRRNIVPLTDYLAAHFNIFHPAMAFMLKNVKGLLEKDLVSELKSVEIEILKKINIPLVLINGRLYNLFTVVKTVMYRCLVSSFSFKGDKL